MSEVVQMTTHNIGERDSPDKLSAFGYETVSPKEKTRKVRGVFDSVSMKYDLMNDLMSFGLHRWWKIYAVEVLDVQSGNRVLDLASGTGDLARIINGLRKDDVSVVCNDINLSMLSLGRDKSLNKSAVKEISYAQASAECLPYQDRTFDRVVMGFGLRNVTDKVKALDEICRVLVSEGVLVILEFSKVKAPLLSFFHKFYTLKVLPKLGGLVTNDSDSYRYLGESIDLHPGQTELSCMVEDAGFNDVKCYNLLGGAVAVHVARRSQ
jgi:demethylmenaquinone methyltransferase/2-methoxy-6-polyprenyl-1,4-benzoquinol methylase